LAGLGNPDFDCVSVEAKSFQSCDDVLVGVDGAACLDPRDHFFKSSGDNVLVDQQQQLQNISKWFRFGWS
jgi:hypothetical protein